MSAIELNSMIVSARRDPFDEYIPLGLAFSSGPYLVPISLNFFTEIDDGPLCLDVFDEQVRARKTASVTGTLILGRQLSFDGDDFFLAFDDESAELGHLAGELIEEGVHFSEEDGYRNIFYIDTIEMEGDLVEASNLQSFFDVLPQVVYEWYHVKPDLLCYLIASKPGYYDQQAKTTELDPRAVDGYSPLIFTDNGFKLSKSGNILYEITEDWTLPIC